MVDKGLVLSLKEEGKTLREIGLLVGVSHQRVHEILYKNAFGTYPPSRLRYNLSDSRKKAQKKYQPTEKGRSTTTKYNLSEKGVASRTKYFQTDKGKAALRKYMKKYRLRKKAERQSKKE